MAELADEAWDFLVTFTEEFSPRESATDEEKDGGRYLVREFEASGLDVELQPFTVDRFSTDPPTLLLQAP